MTSSENFRYLRKEIHDIYKNKVELGESYVGILREQLSNRNSPKFHRKSQFNCNWCKILTNNPEDSFRSNFRIYLHNSI